MIRAPLDCSIVHRKFSCLEQASKFRLFLDNLVFLCKSVFRFESGVSFVINIEILPLNRCIEL